MTALRIVFMGTAELSCASLESLARDSRFHVAAAVTQPDKPRGRDLRTSPSPVKSIALKLNLPVLQPTRARDEKFIGELSGLKPELIVVVAYGHILPPAILELPRHGCLNVHTSLLPKYRGAAPIQWAIANGDTETGVTIMKMDAGLDTGPVLSQRRTAILPSDDSATLHNRLAQLGAELLLETIPDFVAGKIQPHAQPTEGVSLAPKIKKEDGRIDWNLSAKTIWNRLRAFTPWPGAFTSMPDMAGRASPRAGDGCSVEPAARSIRRAAPTLHRLTGSLAAPKQDLLKIWKAEVVEEFSSGVGALSTLRSAATEDGRRPDAAARRPDPGEILSADKNGIVAACGQDAVRILELQREGGRRLTAREFLAGHDLKAGDKFIC